jgi:phosphonate transport system substrate-binding protein
MTSRARSSAPDELVFASLAADNATPFYRSLVGYLSRCLPLPVHLLEDVPWPERERRLIRGMAHIGLVCGLQYTYGQQRRDEPGVELLAAPVMRGMRYQSRPIYFSDVVVRRDHPAESFDALRGARWAYNEPTSHSGYNITRFTLATRGDHAGFFGHAVETGAHQKSLEWVLDGTVDASAIDRTVLEQELRNRPGVASAIRVLTTFEASPIPPLVASRTLPETLRTHLRSVLLGMHGDPVAKEVLTAGAIRRFVRVTDADYDTIRAMARTANHVTLDGVNPDFQYDRHVRDAGRPWHGRDNI